jgi:hypothetical protein
MSFDLVFGGSEVPSHSLLLEGMGVRNFGLNFWRLVQRGLPKTKEYLLDGRFQDNVKVFVDSGEQSLALDIGELKEYNDKLFQFLASNSHRVSFVTLLPGVPQQPYIDLLGLDRVIAMWDSNTGHKGLSALAEQFPHVGITGSSIDGDPTLATRVNAMVSSLGTSFHGIACARPDNLRSVRLDSASTLSWLSPMMRGETVTWMGKLSRYPKSMKQAARLRCRTPAMDAGLDFEKILNDDPNEVTRLAIYSYLKLEEQMQRKNIATNRPIWCKDRSVENTSLDVDNKAFEMRNFSTDLEAVGEDNRPNLPGMKLVDKTVQRKNADGSSRDEVVTVAEVSDASVRQCNTCFVAANCPAFTSNSSCKFKIPVEIKTREQLMSLLDGLLEMQASRVFFARFAEELNGGYIDPNLSLEIDRLFKITEKRKEIESDSSYTKLVIEERGGGTRGGVMSQIFGERPPKELSSPLSEASTSRLMDDIIDGEVVE